MEKQRYNHVNSLLTIFIWFIGYSLYSRRIEYRQRGRKGEGDREEGRGRQRGRKRKTERN